MMENVSVMQNSFPKLSMVTFSSLSKEVREHFASKIDMHLSSIFFYYSPSILKI